ncbi:MULTISPECIES: 4-amino-4-deoxy-L-arabinose-phosphoundecaprenol flippase subunit ArnF [Proteus]|jgi:undecaprenyl phosphate-alpha-L-ara4N flippase subunit ArnF|uniref:Probable 4-amino-4-deoxy-L-arabinose-phosphoundecaprenol flippase subunit ArnF n=1 Tax=Proteus vulgaris TaxID=585 RepID=A0A379F402_PROVU|nr:MULTISPECIES: 4-amino-4-deoxy-L-arabinose-phosphoundecaprenol flippase subunit ArnF [Proteus]NBN61097.1 4-amino-4-deoxy-L-arabinose-phosphoundecaprenol flippase subunit ArnF [Proteus sp. G2639]RNT29345.1 4-amino-4-deoxy-L-arabinose-phosphoundecaprenol flippase subunit ArnF [Proteus mirabilis]AYY80404.1 4-amino-4-deoxy-L-arabinose-phosphoundecaprenol flippase subunit ArnF [Proteus vulgaris]KGA60143.1 eamA-like transporter family protein [Proteus vulgaris]MBG5971531.1 4-amino-4-deoxy-L-arabin
MKGYLWAIGSALLVTVAQLLLKFGMSGLPDLQLEKQWFDFSWLWANITPLSIVFSGLVGYVLSMVCWLFTLRIIPLNKAYPLISLSYVFVYILAVILPWFQETPSWTKTAGVAFIMVGVWLISQKTKGAQSH